MTANYCPINRAECVGKSCAFAVGKELPEGNAGIGCSVQLALLSIISFVED